ncbi:hypothetical protein Q3G72_025552 [Acer saccharum]|nr:hypothetical protein Q3G72_025552 [Acer saccharum]
MTTEASGGRDSDEQAVQLGVGASLSLLRRRGYFRPSCSAPLQHQSSSSAAAALSDHLPPSSTAASPSRLPPYSTTSPSHLPYFSICRLYSHSIFGISFSV